MPETRKPLPGTESALRRLLPVCGNKIEGRARGVNSYERLSKPRWKEQRSLLHDCNYPITNHILSMDTPPKPTSMLVRYMKREMAQGSEMNALYGINFYDGPKVNPAYGAASDAEYELLHLRRLLPSKGRLTLRQQQLVPQHIQRLMLQTTQQLALQLESCFLCGILDAEQLRHLQQLLPLHVMDKEQRDPLTSFFRRLVSDLPHFHYDLSQQQHMQLLQRCLTLRDSQPKLQARRLLAATIEHLCWLQRPQLLQFLDQLNPGQLQQLLQQLKCSYINISAWQLQQLLSATLLVLREKPPLELHGRDRLLLYELLATPPDRPLSNQHRHILQSLLDHLLPLAKAKQLLCLQRLGLNRTHLRQLRSMLGNPAINGEQQQLQQLQRHLKQLLRNPNCSPCIKSA